MLSLNTAPPGDSASHQQSVPKSDSSTVSHARELAKVSGVMHEPLFPMCQDSVGDVSRNVSCFDQAYGWPSCGQEATEVRFLGELARFRVISIPIEVATDQASSSSRGTGRSASLFAEVDIASPREREREREREKSTGGWGGGPMA